MNLLSLGLTLLAAAFCYIALFHFCHMFQQAGYKPREYMKWLAEFGGARIAYMVGMAVFYVAVSVLWPAAHTAWSWVAASVLTVLFLAGCVCFPFKFRVKNAKLPLKYTWRVRRLFGTAAVLLLALAVLCTFCGAPLMSIVVAGGCLLVLVANALNAPIEHLVKRRYQKDAMRRLAARPDLIRIGITGSYGKTSTKFILGTILGEKYRVLVPPSSYNTPMGLTRVIREQLTDAHEVFLAEMGAKHVGDIAELVEMVHPTMGIVTSVGPQHLETFGSIEAVAKTKYELIEGLPADGCAFFPNDGAYTKAMYDKTTCKKYLYTLEGEGDVRAEEVCVSSAGSTFRVVYPGGEFSATTRLLGRHNVQNILGCVAIALELGLSAEEIRRGIAKIQPVEHRLQLIQGAGGVTVIDDAFNSNPAGAKAAMDVLAAFPGRHFVVTPGMIELGAREEEENRRFGEEIASAADIVYLVGPKHTRPIYEGLRAAGFAMERVFVVKSLSEASAQMGAQLKPGDVVLFENDLPDNYNEE